MLQTFLIFITKYGVALLQLNPLNLVYKVVILERTQSNKLKKNKLNLWTMIHQDLAEFNFHDENLIAANESQNISETSNSD